MTTSALTIAAQSATQQRGPRCLSGGPVGGGVCCAVQVLRYRASRAPAPQSHRRGAGLCFPGAQTIQIVCRFLPLTGKKWSTGTGYAITALIPANAGRPPT
jgi:hypothetical protein